jgi:hypothetical protein
MIDQTDLMQKILQNIQQSITDLRSETHEPRSEMREDFLNLR